MYFEQFYLGCLAHASYLLGSEGEAIVVDPQRDVEIYLEAAQKQGLSIRHIFETHLHADFVSGHKELAARTGATIYICGTPEPRFRTSLWKMASRCASESCASKCWRRLATLQKASAWS